MFLEKKLLVLQLTAEMDRNVFPFLFHFQNNFFVARRAFFHRSKKREEKLYANVKEIVAILKRTDDYCLAVSVRRILLFRPNWNCEKNRMNKMTNERPTN